MAKEISRRDFLKVTGAAGLAVTGLAACKDSSSTEGADNIPTGSMTYRSLTGDKVSLLGYGCMRWPMIDSPDGNGQIVDQATVSPSAVIRATRTSSPRKCPTTACTEQVFGVRNCARHL